MTSANFAVFNRARTCLLRQAGGIIVRISNGGHLDVMISHIDSPGAGGVTHNDGDGRFTNITDQVIEGITGGLNMVRRFTTMVA
jgi:hypothetical protein